jgi:hypothetical protein
MGRKNRHKHVSLSTKWIDTLIRMNSLDIHIYDPGNYSLSRYGFSVFKKKFISKDRYIVKNNTYTDGVNMSTEEEVLAYLVNNFILKE